MQNLVKRVFFSAIITTSAILSSGCSNQNQKLIDSYSKAGMYYETKLGYDKDGNPYTITRGIPEQDPIGKIISYFQIWQEVKKRSGGTINLLKIQKQLNQPHPKIETRIHYPPYSNPLKN